MHDAWMPLDQTWNDILQSNFESYIEVRTVTLEELRTRVSAEITASTNMVGNPFWWDSWEADNNFHFDLQAHRLATPPSHEYAFTPVRASANDRSTTPQSALSSNSSAFSPASSESFRLTKEALEMHERHLTRAKSLPARPRESRLKPLTSNQTLPPGMIHAPAPFVRLSFSCQRRKAYFAQVVARDEPFMFIAEDGSVPQMFFTWDDAPELVDMEWERMRALPDPPITPEESAPVTDVVRRSRQSIIALHLLPEATDFALSAKWDEKTEFAYGFAKRDARGHSVEGMSSYLYE
jgi:hypothetical protein